MHISTTIMTLSASDEIHICDNYMIVNRCIRGCDCPCIKYIWIAKIQELQDIVANLVHEYLVKIRTKAKQNHTIVLYALPSLFINMVMGTIY